MLIASGLTQLTLLYYRMPSNPLMLGLEMVLIGWMIFNNFTVNGVSSRRNTARS